MSSTSTAMVFSYFAHCYTPDTQIDTQFNTLIARVLGVFYVPVNHLPLIANRDPIRLSIGNLLIDYLGGCCRYELLRIWDKFQNCIVLVLIED